MTNQPRAETPPLTEKEIAEWEEGIRTCVCGTAPEYGQPPREFPFCDGWDCGTVACLIAARRAAQTENATLREALAWALPFLPEPKGFGDWSLVVAYKNRLANARALLAQQPAEGEGEGEGEAEA